MSLIIRATVVNECTTLAREVETAVRASTDGLIIPPLDEEVIEKICESHVKKIVDDANVQIEKQVEERDYQRQDVQKSLETEEMYTSKRSDISEMTNVHVSRRDDPFNSDFHQVDNYFSDFQKREDCVLDPDNIIEVTEHEPTADIDLVDDADLINHDADSEFWEDYQKTIEIEVDKPYDKFFNCSYKIVKLLKEHCTSGRSVVETLGVLAAHKDYTRVSSIDHLHELAVMMLDLPRTPGASGAPGTSGTSNVNNASSSSNEDYDNGEDDDNGADDEDTEEFKDLPEKGSKKRKLV